MRSSVYDRHYIMFNTIMAWFQTISNWSMEQSSGKAPTLENSSRFSTFLQIYYKVKLIFYNVIIMLLLKGNKIQNRSVIA